jgi:hypothetical protein
MSLDINLTGVEATANKSTNVNTDQASNTKYPSVKAVFDWATNLFFPKPTGTTAQYLRGDGTVATFPTIPSIAGLVPETRTINGLDLSENRTLTASDVGAPSGSGSSTGTNTGDETQSSILSKLGFFVSNRISESTAVTGTTAETIIDNVTIPANTYLNGGIMRIYNSKFRKVGANGLFTVKMYIGPTANNLTGATQIGTFATTGGAPLYIEGLRTFTCTTSGLLGFNATSSAFSDVSGQTSAARQSTAVDWTVAQNIMFTITLASASDSVTMIGNSVKNF